MRCRLLFLAFNFVPNLWREIVCFVSGQNSLQFLSST